MIIVWLINKKHLSVLISLYKFILTLERCVVLSFDRALGTKTVQICWPFFFIHPLENTFNYYNVALTFHSVTIVVYLQTNSISFGR